MQNLLNIFYFLMGSFLFGTVAHAETKAIADVVVIVDTSTSMKKPGMDPEQTSFLVTKLLTDIVPGELAVVRLLDLHADQDVLPRHETGQTEACAEDSSLQCGMVEPASDWKEDARINKLGVLLRPARGDENYKINLKQHLEQRINNSLFHLAFHAAEGVFESHEQHASIPRTIIWLSDGRTSHEYELNAILNKLKGQGIAIEAIIFGQGDTRLAQDAGLNVRKTSNPAELMKVFAGAFRRIVQAPYEIDNLVSIDPRFQIKPNVEEAWIVIYGDNTLGEVSLEGPNNTLIADYAADSLARAGAYKVAYLQHPHAGQWTVSATGGGANVAYAVVQRSNLTPALLEPTSTIADTSVLLVVGIQAGLNGDLVNDPELLKKLTISATFQGKTLILRDDGTQGDQKANDGRYSAKVKFIGSGKVPVQLHLTSPTVKRSITASVAVSGSFKYLGAPLHADLGLLKVAQESCRPLPIQAQQQGDVPFELTALKTIPSGHRLEIRFSNGGTLAPEGQLIFKKPADTFEVCLKTSDDVYSSTANGEAWLRLHVADSAKPEHQLTIHLNWTVEGLTFWERWGDLILLILAIIAILIIIGGFILPHRFSPKLALVFVPDREDVDETSPHPLKQWRGIGIGFYRNAHAFLHPDYRVSGKSQGALVSLHAIKNGVLIKGTNIYKENMDGEWDELSTTKRKGGFGAIYRVGEKGPYFRLASK